MTTVLDRWGNSLGLRLPKGIAEAAGLREGDRVKIGINDDVITIRAARPRYTLSELLEGLTPERVHRELESGDGIGAEKTGE